MNQTIARTVIVLVTLVAIGLGGAVALPAQTLLTAVAGLLLLLAPPRGPLPRVPLILGALLLAIALAAFLPTDSSFVPWRHYLATQCHLPAPADGPYSFPLTGLRSPQPWLTLQAAALLFVGLAWGLYLLTLSWERVDRIFATELLVFGVALLALLATLAFILHFRIPGWTQTENRGWFPNRNQTADVLALTGITAYALIFDRLRKGKRTGYLLLLALVPIVVELVISYSRAGILLFFGGVLAWHLWPRPGQRRGASVKWLALSAALGIVLLSIFLAFGGDTLARFLNPAPSGATTQDITDFRGPIQSDALRFSLQSPWLGAGLGNFEPLFSFSRVASINGNRAIHPESDWLWLAGEMGWPAVALVVAGLVWWLRRALPLENKTGESMRRALIVAVLVFAIHGLVDVSGHRPGSLWVALLLAGMALPTHENARLSRGTPFFFRGGGGGGGGGAAGHCRVVGWLTPRLERPAHHGHAGSDEAGSRPRRARSRGGETRHQRAAHRAARLDALSPARPRRNHRPFPVRRCPPRFRHRRHAESLLDRPSHRRGRGVARRQRTGPRPRRLDRRPAARRTARPRDVPRHGRTGSASLHPARGPRPARLRKCGLPARHPTQLHG
jgi:hypothetical protein